MLTNHPNQFAKFANIANLQTENEDDPKEDYLKTTPSIPDEIYDALPEIFKEGARAFTDSRKKMFFLPVQYRLLAVVCRM